MESILLEKRGTRTSTERGVYVEDVALCMKLRVRNRQKWGEPTELLVLGISSCLSFP